MSKKTAGSVTSTAGVTISQGRRNFLTLAALGAPAVVASAAAGPAKAVETAPGPKAAGYRKTEHVKKYLESAKF